MGKVDRLENVLMLPGGGGAGWRRPLHAEGLRATVRRLDELAGSLQQLSPRMSWSPERCMIASTPFRIRLTRVRKRLDALVPVPLVAHDGARWLMELTDACLDAERTLHDIDMSLHTLQRVESSVSERGRGVEIFASNRSELLTALSVIRQLIAQRIIIEPDEC